MPIVRITMHFVRTSRIIIQQLNNHDTEWTNMYEPSFVLNDSMFDKCAKIDMILVKLMRQNIVAPKSLQSMTATSDRSVHHLQLKVLVSNSKKWRTY